jgi:hypothetical protein
MTLPAFWDVHSEHILFCLIIGVTVNKKTFERSITIK